METTIDVKILKLKDVLIGDDSFYQIPDYQRPYSWDKDNVSDLINDIFDAYQNNHNEEYFCGSIVRVNNESDRRYDVIDGQQRLTTFTILFCVLRELFSNYITGKAKDLIYESIQDRYDEKKRRLRFLTSDKNQIDFEQNILKKITFIDDFKNESSIPNNKYLQNAHFMKMNIEEIFPDMEEFDINDFIIWIFEHIVVTVISTKDIENAIRVFNVLNDRGMPLNPMDIFKSNLMVSLGEEDKKAFKATWNSIDDKVDMNDMLNIYLYYKKSENPKKTFDKELFDIYEKEYGDKKHIDALKSLNEIKGFSEAYDKVTDIETSKNTNIYLLSYLRHKIYWKSILSTALYCNYKEYDELVEVLVAYYYLHWIAGSTIARIKQPSFRIIDAIKKQEPITTVKNICKDSLEKYSILSTYKAELNSSNFYERIWSKPVLLMYEYSMQDNSIVKFVALSKYLHEEHILPQTPKPDSKWIQIFNEEERKNLTSSIGNMTLLSMKKNEQASCDDFEEKKIVYSNKNNVITSFLITQEILNYSKWNKDSIKERSEKIINFINSKLDIFS